MPVSPIAGVSILGPIEGAAREILSKEAVSFVARLHRAFNPTRVQLLRRRLRVERDINNGIFPTFLESTRAIREDPSWKGAAPAPGLVDRRVEITGPVDRKMVINALNSGATQYMADFEDSNAPTWENNIQGQINLRDANLRTVTYEAPASQGGKVYRLRDDGKLSTLLVRPRGWHLEEKHVLIDGEPCSASIFDFGLYFFHNAKRTVELGFGPYFYLPKMESHLEARLWNDIFNMAQDMLGVRRGTIRATVLIETILASFEMEEIIYELRDHSSGLNCGRWDYIFSMIKKFRHFPEFILPDRSSVTMTVPFMDAYVRLLIQTCHKRGVHAMGGMAAQIPIRDNPTANDAAIAKVRADKLREVKAGHDGTWVAHPALVPIAKEIFDTHMPHPNQLHVRNENVKVAASDLLNVAATEGSVSEKGLRGNIHVGVRYMESWLRGLGCVPLENLMEDAATAEISRSQLWQWVYHQVRTSDTHRVITAEYVLSLLDEELESIRKEVGHASYEKNTRFADAGRLFASTIGGGYFADFLTSLCNDLILTPEATSAAQLSKGAKL